MTNLEDLLRQTDIESIRQMSFGQQKIDRLSSDNTLFEFLVRSGFNGYHVSRIVMNAGWQEKLDWVRENYKTVLEPMGFSQSQVAKILKGRGWQDKVDWIEQQYDQQYHTTGEIQQIMVKKSWKDILHYNT